jgi:hypothetical protein
MKIICETLGGSHAYGLNTPTSDLDQRGCFVNTELNKVIGVDRFEHQDLRAGGEDKFLFEFRHFLCSLRKTNTQAMELLFTDNFTTTSNEWELVVKHRYDLIDSAQFFKSILGYMSGEKRLMNGERTGALGSKRKASIESHGFSEKNAVQLLRLAWAAKYFFINGSFPVNVRKIDSGMADILMDIKTHPASYTKAQLNKMVEDAEEEVKRTYDKTTVRFTFNEEVANSLCLAIYYPIVAGLFINNKLCLDNCALFSNESPV